MKVKIIHAETTYALEDEINEFLRLVPSNQILDVKYQGVGNHSAYSTDYPSALIIMK